MTNAKFLDKLHDVFHKTETHAPKDVTPWNEPISKRSKYAIRKQRGVNLGSWFALESWLTGSLFQSLNESGSCDMDIVKGMNLEEAKQLLERHWDSFIDDGDWKWMKAHGINSVRIPILYAHFLAGNKEHTKLLKGTDYASFATVYEGAWQRIVASIEKAASLDIGVLIDLHGVPGGQNGDSHCGKSDGNVSFWNGLHASSNRKLTIQILTALAEAVSQYDNVIGLELMNEPQNHSCLEGFYVDAIKAIRASSSPAVAQLPLYIGDGWDTNHYAKYVGKHSDIGNPLVLDHHMYRCFTSHDHRTSAEQHACDLDIGKQGKTAWWLKGISEHAQGAIIIGEWSGALNPGSLRGCANHLDALKSWSHAQWHAFESYTAGYYYWTLKKEGGPDPGWCFYTAVEKGTMPPSLNPLDGGHVDFNALHQQGVELAQRCLQEHTKYWDSKGGNYDHEQYKHGFEMGWKDALEFLQEGAEVGLPNQLAKLRLASYEQDHDSKNAWEFEHGFRQAWEAFRRTLYG